MHDIKIVRISNDRQSCIDAAGNKHRIQDVARNINRYNVCIRRNTGKHNKNSSIIVYKPNSAGTGTQRCKALGTHDMIVDTVSYDGAKTKDLTIILEDTSSAYHVIKGIVKQFTIDTGIGLTCNYIRAGGCGGIMEALNYCVSENTRNCLVIYDSGINDTVSLAKIRDLVDFMRTSNLVRCIAFEPLCIEQCLMTFKGLLYDIKDLSNQERELISKGHKYVEIGNKANFVGYDITKGSYTLCGRAIAFGYKSSLITRYKNVSSIEQFLADRLAMLTNNRPYKCIKRANECWYRPCKCNGYTCNYERLIGSQFPNSPVNKCNKHYLSSKDSKISDIIHNSMLGVIYECLGILLLNHRSNIVHSDVIESTVRV